MMETKSIAATGQMAKGSKLLRSDAAGHLVENAVTLSRGYVDRNLKKLH